MSPETAIDAPITQARPSESQMLLEDSRQRLGRSAAGRAEQLINLIDKKILPEVELSGADREDGQPAGEYAPRQFRHDDGKVEYTVQPGDTLWNIVEDALSRGGTENAAGADVMKALQAVAQKSQLANPDLIFPGDKIDLGVLQSMQFSQSSPEEKPEQVAGAAHCGNEPTQPVAGRSGERQAESGQPATPPARAPRSRDDWYISQAADGAPASWYACGATSATMALADFGLMEATEGNRQQIIAETGTNRQVGLPGNASALIPALKKRGMEAEYNPSRDWQAVDAELDKGHGVIVNGTTASGVKHFVYISGKDEQGNYILGDPASSGTTRWTSQQLSGFMTRGTNPPGFLAVWK